MNGIVIFLNGERGLAVLDALHSSSHRILAAVTTSKFKSLHNEKLLGLGIQRLILDKVNSTQSIDILKKLYPDLHLVAGFSSIFKKDLLSIPRIGTINLHAGKLPQYRGGSPLNWQLINGESEAGISVSYMDDEIDTGSVLAKATIPINSKDTILDLHQQANRMFPDLVLETLAQFDVGNFKGTPQREQDAIYWHQRNELDGKLNFFKMTSVEVDRFVRALTRPYPGAWTCYKGKTVRIYSVELLPNKLKGTPGRVICRHGKGPYVICKDQGILLKDYTVVEDEDLKLADGTYLDS